MNPEQEINQLLEADGAVLERHSKHDVYKLSNGAKFVRSRTPSDHRAGLNTLSDLRKMMRVEAPNVEGSAMAPEPVVTSAPEPLTAEEVMPTQLLPEPEPPKPLSFQDKLRTMRESQEKLSEQFMARAQQAEGMVKLIKSIEASLTDGSTEQSVVESLFRGMFPAPPPPPAPKPVASPPPPQVITTRVQVTEQLVFAAIYTLSQEFDTNEVLNTMIGSRDIDPLERSRIRVAIWSMIARMVDRGKLIRTQAGVGRRPAMFSLARARS